jgi:amylosucrase
MPVRDSATTWLAAAATRASAALSEPDARSFRGRVDRWGPDVLAGLSVYRGDDDSTWQALADRVLDLITAAARDRRPSLRDLDQQRLLHPDWFCEPDRVGYVCYTDRFAGTLRGVADRIGYLQELGITYLHLMPLLDSRPGPDDGGYAVRDYRAVRPDLGTIEDLAALADALHEAGISLTLDLVLNHVALEHAWAQAAVRGELPYRDYFLWFPDRSLPDAV